MVDVAEQSRPSNLVRDEQPRQVMLDGGEAVPRGGSQLRRARTAAMKCGRRRAWRSRRSSTVIAGAT